jgi:virginiamycin B lyase
MSATALALVLAATLAEPRVTFFNVPRGGDYENCPHAMLAGRDGAMWFVTQTSTFGAELGRITSGGTITLFPFPEGANPFGLAYGPDGTMWASDWTYPVLWKIGENGTIERIEKSDRCVGMAAGPDGALWCTTYGGDAIVRYGPDGSSDRFRVPYVRPTIPPLLPGPRPWDIVAGSDGAMWFTEREGNNVSRITTAGKITQFALPGPDRGPMEIVAGRDGALWFTQERHAAIGRITTAGEITEHAISRPAMDLAAARDGRIWFITYQPTHVGSIDPAGRVVEIALPDPTLYPDAIAIGRDRSVWFTAPIAETIGRVELPVPRKKR